ncbi:Nif11-like leader peptide family RiPP precursor [Thiohalocapsa marina]|nr:Nif11-like leader peptide family RiPP precursor [Thiohalocapsa marina]
MSVEAAKAFVQHIANTDAYESIADAFNAESKTWDADKLIAHGQAAGFEFSGADLATAMPSGEVSDEDLDQVAGGSQTSAARQQMRKQCGYG